VNTGEDVLSVNVDKNIVHDQLCKQMATLRCMLVEGMVEEHYTWTF
jgi:hypothetical protein